MKKLILVFVLVAVYGISISNVSAKVNSVKQTQTMLVSDDDNSGINIEKEEKDKDKKKTATKVTKKETTEVKACCGTKAAATEKAAEKTGCSETQKKSCAASGASCGGEKK